MVNYAILGPVELRDGERRLAIDGPRQLALLAYLLLHANRPVSADELNDALWSDQDPHGLKKRVQNTVARLRDTLAAVAADRPSTLRTVAGGYLLEVASGEVDADVFATLAEEGRAALHGGRAAAAADVLREALALWRGPPLAQLAYHEFAQLEIRRLEEMRLTVVQSRVDADLRLGRHASLIAELEALVAGHPTRERLVAQLMLALYRSGRQADALDAYQRTRQYLASELGLQPSSELQALRAQVLEQSASLDVRSDPHETTAPARDDDHAADGQRGQAAPQRRRERREATASDEAPTAPASVAHDVLRFVSILAARADASDSEVLQRVYERCAAVIERHNGTVEHYLGDVLIGFFGLTESHGDEALRAARAAVDLRAATPELRIGMEVGEVFLRTGPRGETKTGATIAIAGRLAERAAAGEIVLGDKIRLALAAGRRVDVTRAELLQLLTEQPASLVAAHGRIASRALVGRDAELAALRAAMQRAADGAPSLTIVAGEAGIGKSRLAGELARDAHADGALVLTGACLGLSGGNMPYAPLVAALRELAAGPHARLLDTLDPQARAELARLVPELAASAAPPVPAPAAGERGRHYQARLFELLLGLLRRLSHEAVTLLVVEDLHWADPSTRDFLRYAVAHARGERLAIVATYRSDEHDRRHPVRALLAELERSERVRRVELARLTRTEIARQLAGVLDATPDGQLVDEIFERSQGNPFFAEELLATRRPNAGAGDQLPASLRDALLVHADALSPAARDALRVVAAIGRAADHGLLVAASGCDERTLLGALREAVSAHVLVRDGDRLDFRHALMREALYEDLLAGERAALHRAVAQALALAATSENHGELARHWHAAGDLGQAMVASVAAGLHAAGTYAFGDALDHLARALELWPAAPDAHAKTALDHAGLLAEAAEAARLTGDVERATAFCEQALREIDETEQPRRAAHLHERIGRYRTWDPQLALASYGRALALLSPEPSEQRARVLGDEGLALMYLDRLEESRVRCEDALGVARAACAPAEEAYARSTLGVVLAFLGLPAEGEAHLRAALAIAQRLGRAEDVARGHIHLAEVLRYRGRIGEALAVTEDGERAARRLGIADSFGGYLATNAAEDLFHLGRWAAAERRLQAAGFERLEPTGRQLWLGVAGRLAVARGDEDAGRRHLEAARALGDDGVPYEQVASVHAALAELALWRGRPGEARQLVAAGLDLLGDGGDALNTPALLSMGVRAEADAAAHGGKAQRRSHRAAAAALTTRLRRLLDLGEGRSCPPQGRAHLALCEAELARLQRQPDEARRWRCVASAWDELAQPYPAAYARLREAQVLLDRGGPAEAAGALQAARAAAHGLGAGFLLAAAQRAATALPRASRPLG